MRELFDQGCEAIANRSTWEQKQRLYYQMRHDGLRRRNKPWPTAADMHFPMVDMDIRRVKPFWESQATSFDKLASFVSMRSQAQAETAAAGDYFDFVLKNETEFETELLRAIDGMLQRGRGIVRAVVDPFNDNEIVCESIDMPFILMADGAEDFEDADWFIWVRHLSVPAYKRDRRYDADETTINSIRGSKDLDTSSGVFQDKEVREGINYSRNGNQIILWEHWEKTLGGWTVNTFSPQSPEKRLRAPFGCPYKIAGKASLPFYSFKMEVKDKGWYSPRGIAELVQQFEQYACKLWNEKTDAMTFSNRPVLTSDKEISNTASIRWNPGEFVPGNIRGVQMPPPAISFDQELAFVRGLGEQVSMVPDLGITKPGMPGEGSEPRTATENNRIATMQNVQTGSNGRIFRRDLAKLYKHIWGLMLQFRREELSYYIAGELKTVPEQALHDAYLIQPAGSPDEWARSIRQQKADARLQKFANAPNVNQDELVKDSLEADDPLVAQRLFVPTNVAAASEAEDEAGEILLLQSGFPAVVKPNENHAVRIHTLMSWLEAQSVMGATANPMAIQRVQQHLAVHAQLLKQTQPEAYQQVVGEIQQKEMAANARNGMRAAALAQRGMQPVGLDQQ